MDSSLIEFNNVYKSYSISRLKYKRFAEDIGQIFQRVLTRKKRTIQKEKFVALKNVNFKVKQGESLGIIGKNGAGKTTILKLISRVTYPDSGEIKADGKIGAFIELGAGLHPELSGRENIYLYGSILGMRKKEIDEKFDDIVKFSELRKFLDTPIKRYSSGMYARLGFSVVAFMDPDILVIDEVLAVGDKSFQERCLSKMNKFVKGNKTIIFVSHNLEAVKSICDRGILLDHGKIIKDGRVSEVINTYLANYS
ncbi:MAG: Polysaccharide ABC transporter, ATP-binding protein [Candidatus Curtissbacteria bacterium GW2011_GWA1_40_47]|uniref:ABC transporter domain-containing protein n=1 Tax=Candidatus Curtissbacteria bacterium RIFOXYA1_FULL_41_14 TaxID=1797737 RepID=A0A1F5HAN0_9BACT|nr:MAG: Polysaccharide ABC transporter, ATP-binding protein [Candidatus Curtissbacteria bacterium GW2011_GWB1_40_28]KKR62368.1 MAG: Polysaccharide ABC transporter, ATP-binding protein [Microgenomates group bacterium GW2011_GWC1_40_35]KKR66431.1 MAG: Polysaccharide ABC transporter, ATP-binding protein [Candidatus Curtissbacteria bacterium GW2011_GWA1_40_47]KKR77909.1 MAG: Polysaccharide ABC transporter, ATP-binding protein [Candidatus Curtissbacteria bacterium GW2011_GWD1_40_8]KKS02536.1 MAG: Po